MLTVAIIFLTCRLTNRTVALKEIRLQSEEGTPFTAIREGSYGQDVSISAFRQFVTDSMPD